LPSSVKDHSLVLSRFALLLFAGACLLVITLFIMLGQYAYPSADDFCMATGVREVGFFTHLANHYVEWSGRYAGNAFYAVYPLLFGLFDGYPLIAGFLIAALFVALAFALASIFRLSLLHPLVLLVTLGVLCLYLAGLRHSASSLYWMAGALSYQTSGILLLVALGLAVRIHDRMSTDRPLSGLLGALLVIIFVAMGTNEINLIVMTAAMMVAFVHALYKGRKPGLWAGLLLFTLMCFALVYFAPGNAVRESTFPLRHDWLRSIEGSLRMGSWSILAWLGVPVFIVGSLLIPFAVHALARVSPRRFHTTGRGLLLIATITFSIPLVLQFPAWWAMGGWPPPRSVDAIFFVFLLAWLVLIGSLSLHYLPAPRLFNETGRLYSASARVLAALCLLFVLSLVINGRLNRAWHDLNELAAPLHAHLMHRHGLIDAALARGEQAVLLPNYTGEFARSVYFNDIRADWRDWRSICYAQYFGLRAVQLAGPGRTHDGAAVYD